MSAPTTTPRANGRARSPRVPLDLGQVTEPDAAPEPTTVGRAPTPSLDAAVLRVSAKAAKLIRNAQGQVQNRRYEYVTLTAVMDEVLPLLVEEDLLWKVKPTSIDHKPAVRYSMTHIPSGEFDEDVMELECDRTMQAVGSGITYSRRYTLVAYLNLTVDEDDDGLGANEQPRDKYAESAAAHEQLAARTPQPTAKAAQGSERPMNEAQRKMLETRARVKGLPAIAFANVVAVAKGEEPRDPSSTSEEAAGQWLKRELDRLPARLITKVKNGIDAAPEPEAKP